MVTKSKTKTGAKKIRVKVGKLQLNKETVKDLSPSQGKGIRGGAKRESLGVCFSDLCTYTVTTVNHNEVLVRDVAPMKRQRR